MVLQGRVMFLKGNFYKMGNILRIWGSGIMATVRRVDRQGRVALPSDWRAKRLKHSKEVVVSEQDDALVIRPRRKIDLTDYFDSVKVDVDPKVFADYNLLKRALLRGENKDY